MMRLMERPTSRCGRYLLIGDDNCNFAVDSYEFKSCLLRRRISTISASPGYPDIPLSRDEYDTASRLRRNERQAWEVSRCEDNKGRKIHSQVSRSFQTSHVVSQAPNSIILRANSRTPKNMLLRTVWIAKSRPFQYFTVSLLLVLSVGLFGFSPRASAETVVTPDVFQLNVFPQSQLIGV